MRKKTSTGLILGLLSASLIITPCYAATTQSKISAEQGKQKENEKQLNDAQGRIKSLESKKNNLEEYLTELNNQLSELGENLQDIQSQSDARQEELAELETQLGEAQKKEEEQYSKMKLRIQYMYENLNSSYITLFLEAKDLSEFLSQAENMSQMTKYDRKMLEEYKKTTAEIKEKEESIKKEQEKLKKLHKESLEKQDEISSVMKSTRSQMEEYETQISAEKDTTKALLNKINVQSDKINALIKQEKDEEAAQSQKPSVQTPKPDNTAKPENTTKPENKPAPEESKPETPQKPEDNNNNSQESEDQNTSGEKYLGKFKITAYCNGSCCSGHSSGLTASGTVPVQGRTVAMNGITFGTKLKINGSVYTVEDRGVPYGHVDIYFESHEDAMEFGRMYADVYQVN